MFKHLNQVDLNICPCCLKLKKVYLMCFCNKTHIKRNGIGSRKVCLFFLCFSFVANSKLHLSSTWSFVFVKRKKRGYFFLLSKLHMMFYHYFNESYSNKLTIWILNSTSNCHVFFLSWLYGTVIYCKIISGCHFTQAVSRTNT